MLNVNIGKVKSMKLADYYEYRKCEYSYVRLIPALFIRNNNTEKIEILITKMIKKYNK